MSTDKELHARSGSSCELCKETNNLTSFEVPPATTMGFDKSILLCETCITQITQPDTLDANHWRCLNDSMWSVIPAVQVMAWRMLNRLRSEGWPQDLLDILYLEEDVLKWAQVTGEGLEAEDISKHLDSNGVELLTGDNVVLIKDLPVKGANFTAKRGQSVYRITLVKDNAEHIEGKINGQNIVILTKYVKKTN